MNAPSLTDAVAADDEISLLDLLQTLVENLRLLILGPLVVGMLALGVSFLIAPTFTATAQFIPKQQQGSATALLQSLIASGGPPSAATRIKSHSEQFVSFLQSRSLQDALIQRFDLMARYSADFAQDARLELGKNSRMSIDKGGLISVSVDDKDPRFAADLANAYLVELSELLGQLALTEAQQRRVFFEKQLANARDALAVADKALQVFGASAPAIKADTSAAVVELAQLQANITAQEVKIAAMRDYLSDSAPNFRLALTELAALHTQLGRAEQALAPAISGDSGHIAKFRDFKYKEVLIELFTRQLKLAQVDESREGELIQVVDVAIPPERKTKPKRGLVAVLASLIAGFALLLFVFMRQAVRNASHNVDSAAKLLRVRQAWARALGWQINRSP